MKILTKFTSKSGKEILVIEPDLKFLNQITEFINRLAKEDTFLSFLPNKEITKKEEKKWLVNTLNQIKNNRTISVWAIYDNKIVGTCDCIKGGTRDPHVGTVGLMVDQDFRSDGIGRFLFDYIIQETKKRGVKILVLSLFSDNEIASSMYKKFGFKEYGNLPKGLYRKGKFSDHIWMFKTL